VVGTAPTSVMVITKFVYRRSWQANTNTIKAFERDSIKIMKLNKKQQSQPTQAKKATLTTFENMPYEVISELDHSFINIINYIGDDISIAQ
jgi:thymidylate synthase (FAD)